jgi:hypothetical protein
VLFRSYWGLVSKPSTEFTSQRRQIRVATHLHTWPAPPMPVLKGFLCLTHVSSWIEGSWRFCCCCWCACCCCCCCCCCAERLVSLPPSSDNRSTSPPLLLAPSAVEGVVRRSGLGRGVCWMPCECSIRRSASSSSSFDRSWDMGAGACASAVARLGVDMTMR